MYDEATLKCASILTKSKNPNLVDGHTNKIFSIVNHPTNPQVLSTNQNTNASYLHLTRSLYLVAGMATFMSGMQGNLTVLENFKDPS